MKLAPEVHRQLQDFFREFFADEKLILPPIIFYRGFWASKICKNMKIAAITFGRRIFIDPDLLRRGENGLLTAPAYLIAHEATHVLQYQKLGFGWFLISYVCAWLKILRRGKKRDLESRWKAYRRIPHEWQAKRVERAFLSRGVRSGR